MLTPTQVTHARARLETERARLQALIRELDAEVEQLSAYEETEHGTLGNHQADIGTDVFEQEQTLSLERNERELLKRVEQALARLDEGTYGQCARCGRPIALERLEAIPYAVYCITCQAIIERQRQ